MFSKWEFTSNYIFLKTVGKINYKALRNFSFDSNFTVLRFDTSDYTLEYIWNAKIKGIVNVKKLKESKIVNTQ